MNLEQFKTTVGPRRRELVASVICLAQIHAFINNEAAFEMMARLVEACLADEWGIDPAIVSAASEFIDAQLGGQEWTFSIDKNGDLLQSNIFFKPRVNDAN